VDIHKAINRERKKKKEHRKKEKVVIVDRTSGYKNKTLNIKKRREVKELVEEYAGGMWVIREDN